MFIDLFICLLMVVSLSQPKITPTWEFVSLTIYRGQLT